MKRIRTIAILMAMLMAVPCFSGCSKKDNGGLKPGTNGQVKVLNWGEYIDDDVIDMFERETGIEVIYDVFETNEDMYPIISAGGADYDTVCPSDYMIEKMIKNNLLLELDWDNIPNREYISDTVMENSQVFDPGNKYSVPYTFGTLGILYNSTMVDKPVNSWNILWDEDYAKEIIVYNSPRDLFVAPLALLGYSINTTNEAELNEAKELLIKQKPLVQRYVMDQIKDIMISGEAALAMCYSGEVLQLQSENEDLVYVVPDEGSNYFIDSWVIPKTAKNKENAEAWINFLNRPDIALKNFEYITYSTPNTGAQAEMSEELLNNPAVFPSDDILKKCEVFYSLGEEGDQLFNNLWLEVKDASVN